MLEIKKVSTADPEYAEIAENHFFRNPVYSDALKHICESSGVSLYVAMKGDNVCGFAAADAAGSWCTVPKTSCAQGFRCGSF